MLCKKETQKSFKYIYIYIAQQSLDEEYIRHIIQDNKYKSINAKYKCITPTTLHNMGAHLGFQN